MRSRHLAIVAALLGAVTLAGCARRATTPMAAADSAAADHRAMDHAAHGSAVRAGAPARDSARGDTSFAALQARGAVAMGVDQYASSHRFESLDDGGRIELQVDSADAAATERIRDHLRTITRSFARGDFATPGFVHDGEVPGTRVMRERRERITYTFAPLRRGGEVIISTPDAAAVEAIHAFLAFQRREHRTHER